MFYKDTTAVKMPANYVLMYDVLPKEQAKTEAQKADSEIKKIAGYIKTIQQINLNPQMTGHKSFSVIAPLFNSLMRCV